MASTNERPRAWRRLAPDARRALILEAVRACVGESGLDAATARRIAARSGIALGTLTHHFSSLDALLGEALAEASHEFTERAAAVADGAATARERLRALVDAAFPDHDEALVMWRLWLAYWARAIHDPALAATHTERYRVWRGAFENAIADGVARGEFAPVDPTVAARELSGLFDGLAIQTAMGDADLADGGGKRLLHGAIDRLVAQA